MITAHKIKWSIVIATATISAATEKGKTMENEVKCPECGGEPEVLYVNKAGEIVGCEFCLKAKYWFEVEV